MLLCLSLHRRYPKDTLKVRIRKKVNFELIRRINKANIRFVTRVVQSKYRSPHEEWNPTTSDFALRSAHAHIIPSELLEQWITPSIG